MTHFTTIEQSEKLVELGIDPSTADMYYPNRIDIKGDYALPIEVKRGNPLLSQEIPCWSLGALLELIPKTTFKLTKCPYYNWPAIIKVTRDWNFRVYETATYTENTIFETSSDTLLGNVYEMVCWLKAQKNI